MSQTEVKVQAKKKKKSFYTDIEKENTKLSKSTKSYQIKQNLRS